MINFKKAVENLEEPKPSVVELELTAAFEETDEEFADRVARLEAGLHRIDFAKVGPRTQKITVQINQGVGEPEEFDPSKLSRADLLSDFEVNPQADPRAKNNVEY